jgi:hypothetical protein
MFEVDKEVLKIGAAAAAGTAVAIGVVKLGGWLWGKVTEPKKDEKK